MPPEAGTNVSELPKKSSSKAPGPIEQFGQFGALDNAEVQQAIQQAIEEMNGLDLQSKSINEQRKAVRAGIEARGINIHAFNAAVRYSKMNDGQQDGFDLSLGISRKAMELPIQSALFDPAAKNGAPSKH